MSGLAAQAWRGQPRPGLSRFRLARRDSRGGGAGAEGRLQPICAVARDSRAARGGRGPLRAPFRAAAVSRPCVRDQRRDRGARRGDPGDGRARRRSDHLHPGLRQLCADDPRARAGSRARWRCSRRAGGSIATAIEAAVSPKTRAILFNNPHNPAGRLFDADELDVIASVARDHDLIVISDEVWEHISLDGGDFTPLASLPGMAERTIKIGSAGKIFSLTGWKVGWMVAAPELAAVVARAHQFLTFCTAPNLQAAVAFGLDEGDALDRADAAPLRARARPHDARACATPASPCSTPPRLTSCASILQASGVSARRRQLRRRRGRKGRRRGRAAVRLRRAATRRATSSASASARRTRRSTPASPRWPRPRSCSA